MKQSNSPRVGEAILVVFFILATVIVNLSTFFYRCVTTPPGRVFVGTQFYSDDYAVYVADIKQGQEGRWLVEDKFTTEPHPASLIHEEYLLWGKLTGLLGLPPILAYHLGRGMFGLIFLVLIWLFLLKIFPRKEDAWLRIASLFLICFGNGLPYLSWLTDLDATQRFAPVPHYLLGFIGILGVFIGVISKKSWFWLGFFGILGGFALPSSLIVVVSVLLIYSLIQPRTLLIVGFLLLVNLPFLIYYRQILTVPPWSHILAAEAANRGPFTFREYLLAIGPIGLLGLFGLLVVKQKPKQVVFLFSWVAASFLWSFFLADAFRLNPTRFLQIPLYIPLSILTVLGLNQLFKKTWQVLLLTAVIVVMSLPTSVDSLKGQFRMYADYASLIYPEDFYLEAFDFLDKNTAADKNVLALYHGGNLIPFLAGNTVYLGHLQETLNYSSKVDRATLFFSGQLNPSQAKEFLVTNHLSLVYLGPQEKSYGGSQIIKAYPFLEPIFDNSQIIIFQLKNV